MRVFLQALLIIAVSFGTVLGSAVVVEVEHSHEVSTGHDHHPHEDEAPSPDEDSRDGEEHSHSHVVSLGADSPFVAPEFPTAQTISAKSLANLLPASDQFPDGPCFALIKPPQLG
ncbi:MAG: hypothetical protein IZT59_07460 [Verrucomicrobia bacterium]|jgi:hypothetical protein|nr:hypothetical protein [Verrucomicrobiota bacterium]|tara:strand:+ start:61467 stop:61811 length:345 start_codon:yes stop_codon:yes gene_type:complete